jgi:hypothetical protein
MDLRELIKETLEEHLNKSLIIKETSLLKSSYRRIKSENVWFVLSGTLPLNVKLKKDIDLIKKLCK